MKDQALRAFECAERAKARAFLDMIELGGGKPRNRLPIAAAHVRGAQEIQQALSSDSALIEYYLSEDLLLIFIITNDIFDLTPVEKSEVEGLLLKCEQFERHMSGFLQDRSSLQAMIEIAAALYDYLLQPVKLDWDKLTRLFIVPHGRLYGLPFCALFDRNSSCFLIERAAVTQVPSASIWHYLSVKREARSQTHSYFGVANPRSGPFLFSVQDGQRTDQIVQALNNSTIPDAFRAAFRDNGFPLSDQASVEVVKADAEWHITDQGRVFSIRLEDGTLNIYQGHSAWRLDPSLQQDIVGCESVVKSVAKLFDRDFNETQCGKDKEYHSNNACVLLREKATYALFKQYLKDYTIVDLESHAYYDPGRPMRSVFVLVEEEGKPRWITAEEVLDLQLHPEFQLLVLATCYGGEVKVTPGNDLLGLIHAFMAIGARSILSYRWPLLDEPPTVEFLNTFYKSWIQEGNPKDQALQDAQTKLIEQGRCGKGLKGLPTLDHPYYWAWTLIGDHL